MLRAAEGSKETERPRLESADGLTQGSKVVGAEEGGSGWRSGMFGGGEAEGRAAGYGDGVQRAGPEEWGRVQGAREEGAGWRAIINEVQLRREEDQERLRRQGVSSGEWKTEGAGGAEQPSSGAAEVVQKDGEDSRSRSPQSLEGAAPEPAAQAAVMSAAADSGQEASSADDAPGKATQLLVTLAGIQAAVSAAFLVIGLLAPQWASIAVLKTPGAPGWLCASLMMLAAAQLPSLATALYVRQAASAGFAALPFVRTLQLGLAANAAFTLLTLALAASLHAPAFFGVFGAASALGLAVGLLKIPAAAEAPNAPSEEAQAAPPSLGEKLKMGVLTVIVKVGYIGTSFQLQHLYPLGYVLLSGLLIWQGALQLLCTPSGVNTLLGLMPPCNGPAVLTARLMGAALLGCGALTWALKQVADRELLLASWARQLNGALAASTGLISLIITWVLLNGLAMPRQEPLCLLAVCALASIFSGFLALRPPPPSLAAADRVVSAKPLSGGVELESDVRLRLALQSPAVFLSCMAGSKS